MRSLPGIVIVDVRFSLLVSTLNISCHSLLTCRVSAERSAVNCMGFSLICYLLLFLAAFNILSLCLISVNLLNIHLDVILLGFIL